MEGLSDLFDFVMKALVVLFFVSFLAVGYILIDWIFIPTKIESNHRIEPQLVYTIKNNKLDTIYIYRK